MSPAKPPENSVFGKAKVFLGIEIARRKAEKDPQFVEFKKSVSGRLKKQSNKFQEFVEKYNLPNKSYAKEIYLQLFKISMFTVLADNKVTQEEIYSFQDQMKRNFDYLKTAVIENNVLKEDKKFENFNIENIKNIRGAKFDLSIKNLKEYGDKKNKYYASLLKNVSCSAKLKSLIERTKYKIETNVQEEILRIKVDLLTPEAIKENRIKYINEELIYV